jgi:O-antigen ligase
LNAAIAGRLESCLFLFFLAVLLWAPLPFASNRAWGGALLAVLLSAAVALWLLLYLFGQARLNAGVMRYAGAPLALLLGVQCWVALQLLPVPPALLEALSPRAAEWRLEEGWRGISLDPAYGRFYLLEGLSYTAGFFLTLSLVNTASRLRLLLGALVFSGTFQAAYGALMVLSGLELGFFVEKYVGLGVATGTFVNRNHLAGYLVMCLAAGTGLLLSQLSRESPRGWRSKARHWLRLALSPRLRLRVYLAVMVVALVLTRSRSGNIAFFVALAAAGAIALYGGYHFSRRVFVFLASLFLVDMLILGRWFGVDRLVARFGSVPISEEERIWSSGYALDYVREFPLTGSGGGSFYGIFPNFQAANLEGFHEHAHNDYLQFAAELGIPATLVLLAAVLLALNAAVRAQLARRQRLMKGAGFAATMTICWAAVHSFTDFNLQVAANALTFTVMLAVAFVARGLDGPAGAA